MDNITNVTINFGLFEAAIKSSLKKFHMVKERYDHGEVDEASVLKKADEVSEQIVFYTELLGARLELINEYMDDKYHNKQALRTERKEITNKISRYQGVLNSIDDECKEIENGDCDIFDDEDEFDL